MSLLDEICKEIVEWHKKTEALEAENARFKSTSYEAELIGLRTELLELKRKCMAFLDETLHISNAIQVMKDGYDVPEYEDVWAILRASRHSLRGDTGAGKDLKEAIK